MITAAAPRVSVPAHKTYTAATPDGLGLSVQDWGQGDGGIRRDVLFIHGFSQSHLCWLRQVASPLKEKYRLVTYDLRGHGGSDKPHGDSRYAAARLWADDVASVMRQAALRRPIIVAWSYAGRVALDYISCYGDQALGGLAMVSATSASGDGRFLGPASRLLARMSDASEETADRGTRQFLEQCTHMPLDEVALDFMLAYNRLTPIYVRQALRKRAADYDDTIRSIRIPLLAVHGERDQVILPEMSHHTLEIAGHGRKRIYPDVGHAPFWEEPDRFNDDLSAFIDNCT